MQGLLLALASAVAFGLTIPVLGWAGTGVDPFSTAALLYTGAGLAAVISRRFVRDVGGPLTSAALPTLVLMATVGAAVAPALLAWGLQRTGPVTGGLLLNFEAVFTLVLARLFYREHLGPRAVAAAILMTSGGVILSGLRHGDARFQLFGVLAVVGAAFAWAIDNTASRRVAEVQPLRVVAVKSAFGVILSVALAVLTGAPTPSLWMGTALVLAGATGYGASLRLYLLAQRKAGAARTASVFALAPFIGAALGTAVTRAPLGWTTVAAGVLFAGGVALHLSERHAHRHRHEGIEHEHAHRHDDGHHTHHHAEPVLGEHSHRHVHEPLEHEHEHGFDIHHGHTH